MKNRRKRALRAQLRKERGLRLETLEERRLLAVGPQLMGIQPNIGELLTDNQVRETAPLELTFLFNSTADIDAASLPTDEANPARYDSIQLTRSGLDGTFEHASTLSDFNTDGTVQIEFEAVAAGQSGSLVTIAVDRADLGETRVPTISVLNSTISVTLNTRTDFETTARDLVLAINSDTEASGLVTAAIRRGSGSTDIATPEITYSPLTMDAANTATATSDFNTRSGLLVKFAAASPGQDGNGIMISVSRADLGDGTAPVISVSETAVSVVVNANIDTPTTAQQLIDAINGDLEASALVTASIPSGSPDTAVGLPLVNYSPIVLSGANDVRIEPGYLDLGDSAREVVMRFDDHLPDDVYLVEVLGTGQAPLVDLNGNPFNEGQDFQMSFELDLGAQIVSVVPQPIYRDAPVGPDDPGALVQHRNQIVVYFNNDDLDPASAEDPRFYQLIHTRETVTNTDDIVLTPLLVQYDADTDMAVLTFSQPLEQLVDPLTGTVVGPGTFRLRIGTDEAHPLAPREFAVGADPGSSFDTALNLHGVWDTGPAISVLGEGNRFAEGQTFSITDRVGVEQIFEFDTGYVLKVPPSGGNAIANGDTFSITKGASTVVFEFDTGDGVQTGHVIVPFNTLQSADDITNSIVTAVAGSGIVVPTKLSSVSIHLGDCTLDTTGGALTHVGQPGAQTPDAIAVPFVPDSSFTRAQMAVSMTTAINSASFAVVATADGQLVRLDGDQEIQFSDSISSLNLVSEGVVLSSAIQSQTIYALDLPGGNDEPGHRDIPSVEDHLYAGADVVAGITTYYYNFQDEYGVDPLTGQVLHNQIRKSENEQNRAREVFDYFSEYLGVQFIESDASGFTIVTGDLRVLDPDVLTGPGGVAGLAGDGMAIMDLQDFSNPGDDQPGGSWFQVAMHEIGHLLGLGHTYDLPSLTIMGSEPALSFGQTAEPVFPGDVDVVHGQHLYRPESNDIDMYRFELVDSGLFTAEAFAERQATPSGLDTVLTLYKATLDGTGRVLQRELVSRNDDYFSNDSYLEMLLEPGTYYVGISASGNSDYDPAIEDTGFGGRTEGDYGLRLNFRPNVDKTIVDQTGVALDGDADGLAGGIYNSWFRAASPAVPGGSAAPQTLFVDKAAADGGDGTLANPFNLIPDALAAADANDVVRIVGNAGADGDVTTLGDNLAYQIGFSQVGGAILEDGATLEVPQGVTVMVDANAIFKLRNARIGVGSSEQGIDRSAGALQVLGTPRLLDDAGNVILDQGGRPVVGSVFLTSLHDDQVGQDNNPDQSPPPAQAGDWGGLVFRTDLDVADGTRRVYSDDGIFLNTVNHAQMTYGGGSVIINGSPQVVAPIHLIDDRPTLSFNTIQLSADAAISANPDSFEEDNFHAPKFQTTLFTSDYQRVGPEIHHNTVVDNSLNGLFIRIATPAGDELEQLAKSARWNDTDIVHIVAENLIVQGQPGGPLQHAGQPLQARLDGRLSIDPATVVKLDRARIDTSFGAQLIAEGRDGQPIVFTSINDARYGFGGTFDTNLQQGAVDPVAGDWAGLYLGPLSRGSLDFAVLAYGGGTTKIGGTFTGFNPIEIHQSDVRIAHSKLEMNADGSGGLAPPDRSGRGTHDSSTIFVRGAQPIIVSNTFVDNDGAVISINVNALNFQTVPDRGRETGPIDRIDGYRDNEGPLVRLNQLGSSRSDGSTLNGMLVRGGTLTTQGIWDDTDIVHVLRDTIYVPDFHTYGGLRLESNPRQSLVVKLEGATAGFTATGRELDITDRIGGSLQVVGQPRFPVILTSLADDSAGAGFTPDGLSQTDTNGDGSGEGRLPTGPEVDQGTLIDNDVAVGIPGQFAFKVLDGGSSDFFPPDGQVGGISAQGDQSLFVNENVIFDSTNYLDIGANGNAIDLRFSTITTPATLIDNDLVVSEGTVQGANGPINWRVETHMDDGIAIVYNTLYLSSDSPLGDIRFINYLDEDVRFVSDDFLYTSGTPGQDDFRAFTLDDAERVGFSQGGIYSPGPMMSNATYDGWTADTYANLQFDITSGGTTYSPAGNINTANLPSFIDPELGQAYGLGDVTTAFAWSVDPTATEATMTSLLELVPRNPATLGKPGDWAGIELAEFSNDRNVDTITEREPRDAVGGADSNETPSSSQSLGQLAPTDVSGDDTRRLGFEVHGVLSEPADVDVYSFEASPGTEVWLDIDRVNNSLDTVVELVDADGNILVQSDNSLDEERGTLPIYVDLSKMDLDQVHPLRKSASEFYPTSAQGEPKDLWSTNPLDAGMRLILPGSAGTTNTYYVRVRSSNLKPGDPQSNLQDPAKLNAGLTAGSYQLQVRLREVDEVPGSTVQYSDIRYATNGITISGQPTHSPLQGEASEDQTPNNSLGTAQPVGNVLNSEQATIGVAGGLGAPNDVDFYQFEINYDSIQNIPGFTNPVQHLSTIFDLDYADGYARANTRLAIFDSQGRLVLQANDSNIADDQAAPLSASGPADLSRGSLGTSDPFLGTQELTAGTYYLAVSSEAMIPREYQQFFQAVPANPLFRLEPINSVERVIEDHLDGSGFSSTGEAPQIPLLFDNQSIVPYALGDVVLFVTEDATNNSTNVVTVDPFTGVRETTVGSFGVPIGDSVMRGDGTLHAFSFGTNDATSGNYLQIDTGNGSVSTIGDDGIATWEWNGQIPPGDQASNVGYQFLAAAYGPDAIGGTALFAVGLRAPGPGVADTQNILYQFNQNTGAGTSGPPPAQDRGGCGTPTGCLFFGAGTQIVERGFLDTTAGSTANTDRWLIVTEATEVSSGNGNTRTRIRDGLQFQVDHDGNAGTPSLVFEFNSGPEVMIHPDPAGGSFIQDGDRFFLDGVPYEFDTGSVIVVDASNGSEINDGDWITVEDDAAMSLTFEFDKGDGIAPTSDLAIPINNGMQTAQLMTQIVTSINGAAGLGFMMTAEALANSNRITLLNESPIAGATATPGAAVTIEGSPGGASGTVIPIEETFDRDQLGAALANRFNVGAGVSGITVGWDGARVNFSGAILGDFAEIEARGVFTDQGSDGITANPAAIGIPFLAEDTGADIGARVTTFLNATGISAVQDEQLVQLTGATPRTTFTSAQSPLRIAGASPGGLITGIATVNDTMYAVTSTGGLFRVNNPTSYGGATVTYIPTSAQDLLGIQFQALTSGPAGTEGGRYANMLFGMDRGGTLYAFDTAGRLQSVFVDGQTSIRTGAGSVNGIAFSTLQDNPWGFTNARELDSGHGVDTSSDLSRSTPNFPLEGGSSLYVGTGGNYNWPGGGYGTLESNAFSLAGYSAADKPVLYFNYFAETEQTSWDPTVPQAMYDSFRVFIGDESGQWDLLGTNDGGSGAASSGPNLVQEVFDNGNGWRQVRVALDSYAGDDNLKLRIDFSTAGTMNVGGLRTTGVELRVLPAAQLSDGQTFTVGGQTFEIDLGYTMIAPTGAALQDGDTFSIEDAAGIIRVYEFDEVDSNGNSDGVAGSNHRVAYQAVDTAEQIAQAMENAILDSIALPLTLDLISTEPQDTLSHAVVSGLNGSTQTLVGSGRIGDNVAIAAELDVDMIRVDLAAGSRMTVDVDIPAGSTLDAALRLFDANGVELMQSDDVNGNEPLLTFTAAEAGAYYIGVSGSPNLIYDSDLEGSGIPGSFGDYDLSIAVDNPVAFTQLNQNRLNLPAAVSVTTIGQLTVVGSNGVTNGLPVHLHAGMQLPQVVDVVRQALADVFAGGDIGVISSYNEVIRIIGHVVDDSGPFGLTDQLPGDSEGSFFSNRRGQNNQFEGVYLDDFIIGFAERGEIATGASGDSAFYANPQLPASQILVGPYQLEIRRGESYGTSTEADDAGGNRLELNNGMDTNDRLSQAFSLIAAPAEQISDGQTFTLSDGVGQLTFEFDDASINDGVAVGNVEIEFNPAVYDAVTDDLRPQTAAEVAATIRDAINSPQVQARLNLAAGLADGATTAADFSTSNVVNLYGDADTSVTTAALNIVSTTTDANQLRDALLDGSGFTAIGDATLVSGANSAGLFVGGQSTIGIDSGIVLTTGDARFTEGPNVAGDSSGRASQSGDPDLDAAFTPLVTEDTTALEFAFDVPAGGTDLAFQFVFSSEEYNEFVGNANHDVFALFVDGQSIGFVPGTLTPVSSSTVNGGNPFGSGGVNERFYNNNSLQDAGGYLDSFGHDGFTDVFEARISGLTAGQHTMKLAISDVGNMNIDSAIFVRSLNDLSSVPQTEMVGTVANSRGDSNHERDQGQVVIHSNKISNSLDFGIVVQAGARSAEGKPHAGPVRVTRMVNDVNLVTGVVLDNNLIYRNSAGGIDLSGDPNTGGQTTAPVPFGRVVNNTIVGGGVGIRVQDNASPTLLNNVVADTDVGIEIDASSSSSVVAGTVYGGVVTPANTGSIGLGEFPITVATSRELFMDQGLDNYYPAEQSAVIDSSIDALDDRAEMLSIRNPLGIPPSPILSPDLDLLGQRRVDDPDVATPSGLGQNVFKDRGAIDRSDFAGPSAILVTPLDNDAAGVDGDARETYVELVNATLFDFSIQLLDGIEPSNQSNGTGADPNSVTPESVLVTKDNVALEEGVDYRFSYDATGRVIRLTPLAGIWEPDHAYEVQLLNEDIVAISADSGEMIADGDSFAVTDLLSQSVLFEFDSGYTMQVPAAGGADIVDGNVFTIQVDTTTYRFEFDDNGFSQPTSITVRFDAAQTAEEVADSIVAAIRDANIGLSPTHSGGGLVQLGGDETVVLDASGTTLTQAGAPGVAPGSTPVPFTPSVSFDSEQVAVAIADAINGSTLSGVSAVARLGTVIVHDAAGVQGLRSQAIGGIRDLAGNILQANRFDGSTTFTIFMGSGLDYGDAPDPTFPVLRANDGARHSIVDGFMLGSTVFSSVDGLPSIGADADPGDDGVTFTTLTVGYETTVDVVATGISAGQLGRLDAWIDFNGDGQWDSSEQIADSQLLANAPTKNTITFRVPNNNSVAGAPPRTVAGETYARFRLSSTGGLQPTGEAIDGEVEDYRVTIDANPWQNSAERLDVNNDGHISPLDALLVINLLNRKSSANPGDEIYGPLPNPPTATFNPDPPPGYTYYSTTGNSEVGPLDALLVINYLNKQAAGTLSEGEAPLGRSISGAEGEAPVSAAGALGLLGDPIVVDAMSTSPARTSDATRITPDAEPSSDSLLYTGQAKSDRGTSDLRRRLLDGHFRSEQMEDLLDQIAHEVGDAVEDGGSVDAFFTHYDG